jgi:hypothetical protein
MNDQHHISIAQSPVPSSGNSSPLIALIYQGGMAVAIILAMAIFTGLLVEKLTKLIKTLK